MKAGRNLAVQTEAMAISRDGRYKLRPDERMAPESSPSKEEVWIISY